MWAVRGYNALLTPFVHRRTTHLKPSASEYIIPTTTRISSIHGEAT